MLETPFGRNLMNLVKEEDIQEDQKLLKLIADYFEPYGYKILFNSTENRIQILRQPNDFSYETIELYMVADTLLRRIYYDIAIQTHQYDWLERPYLLLLEEPEAYSYPTYVSELAYEIANDEHNNQYLLTTHSPHMIYKLIDELSYEELNIVGVYFEDFQTKVKVFTEDELYELLNMGYDLFFSLPSFFSHTTEPA